MKNVFFEKWTELRPIQYTGLFGVTSDLRNSKNGDPLMRIRTMITLSISTIWSGTWYSGVMTSDFKNPRMATDCPVAGANMNRHSDRASLDHYWATVKIAISLSAEIPNNLHNANEGGLPTLAYMTRPFRALEGHYMVSLTALFAP